MSEAPTDSANAAEAKDEVDQVDEVEVVVNGQVTQLVGSCSVADLLVSLHISTAAGRRVAVAVNRNIVVRSSYPDVELATGDRIEILEAVGGG